MSGVIFLDVDGVLNIESETYATGLHAPYLLEPHLVFRLNKIIEKTDAGLIISSSWRKMMPDLLEDLEGVGFKYSEKVIGRTSIPPESDKIPRGVLIAEWLDMNPGLFEKSVVIDDEDDGITPFSGADLFIRVDKTTGLTDSDARKIIDFLS